MIESEILQCKNGWEIEQVDTPSATVWIIRSPGKGRLPGQRYRYYDQEEAERDFNTQANGGRIGEPL